MDLPLGDLRHGYPQAVGNRAIDNETGSGLPAPVELIGATAAGLPLMGTEWPRSWLDAAEAVQRIPDSHVTPARLRRTMAEAGLRDARHQRHVAGALHTLGTILYHAEDPELRDTVILRPEWADNSIVPRPRAETSGAAAWQDVREPSPEHVKGLLACQAGT